MSMTGSKYGFWDTRLGRWFLARVPIYGNWGGPGWSAGRICHDPGEVDWDCPAKDSMDALFKAHDWEWQHGKSRLRADVELVDALHRIDGHALYRPIYGRLYRRSAIFLFVLRIVLVLLVKGEQPCDTT